MRGCEVILKKALAEDRFSLLANEAKQICNLHDIPSPRSHVASNVQEAVLKSREIGFPVVLKILSPQILHKSDVGGVILNVRDENELKVKYEKLITAINHQVPSAKILGVLVEKMMPASTELIIGGIRDGQFGPSVMFGIGGIFTEIYNDVSFRVAPIDRVDAWNLIHNLKGFRILEGSRGKPPADLDLIVNVIVNVSELMIEHDSINQLDLNPVIAYPDSICAVDSRIVIGQVGGGA